MNDVEYKEAYDATSTDREAAKRLGIELTKFWRWRNGQGLPVKLANVADNDQSVTPAAADPETLADTEVEIPIIHRAKRRPRTDSDFTKSSRWGGSPCSSTRRPRSEVQQFIKQVVTEFSGKDLVEMFFGVEDIEELMGNPGKYANIWLDTVEKACHEKSKQLAAEKEET